jgi:O-antigen/teichoic acid export membrane protein
MKPIGSRIAAGAAWMLLFKLLERSLGFASTLILARLLVPADFGLVAMGTSLLIMLEYFSGFGIDLALIRHPAPERRHYDTGWTLNAGLAALIAIVMMIAAYPLALFYRQPELTYVVLALSLAALAQGLENIGTVQFRKELDFPREFRFQISKKIAAFLVMVPLAVAFRTYWALVAGLIAGRFAATLLSYLWHPYRPRFSLAARSELLGFSKWLALSNTFHVLRERVSDLVVGRLAGPGPLGLYSLGYEVANLPTSELVLPINRATIPGYSLLTGDVARLRAGFLSVIGMIALLVIPAGLGIAATALPATHVLLGKSWLGAVPVIEILAFYGILTALQANCFPIYVATGRPDLQTRLNGFYLLLLIPTMIVLTRAYGLSGAALSSVATASIILPINFTMVLHRLQGSWKQIVAIVWRPLTAATVMAVCVRGWLADADAEATVAEQLLILIAAILIGATIYAGMMLLLWGLSGRPDGAERFVTDRLRGLLRTIRGGLARGTRS